VHTCTLNRSSLLRFSIRFCVVLNKASFTHLNLKGFYLVDGEDDRLVVHLRDFKVL
jgi:hypothetical protein